MENLIIPVVVKGIYVYTYPSNFDPANNWVHRYISWRRSLTEWIQLIDELRRPIFPVSTTFTFQCPPSPPYIPNMVPDVWHHRAIAADQLQAAFEANQRVRFQMQRVAMFLRRRVMDGRPIGADADVGTMEPIPPRHCVRVYDWGSRSVYHFHASTIHNNITAALRYQSYGISIPKYPKNPYTNIPWSTGQLTVIFDQIHRSFWNTGRRFMSAAAQVFYRARMSLIQFQLLYGDELDIDAAKRFFYDRTSEGWDFIYDEILGDVFAVLKPAREQFLRNLIVDRSLDDTLLKEWDAVVIGFWCYENLRRIVYHNTCSIYELVEESRKLLKRTEEFLVERRKQKRKAIARHM